MRSNEGGGLPPMASSATPLEQRPSPNDRRNTQPDPAQRIPPPIPQQRGKQTGCAEQADPQRNAKHLPETRLTRPHALPALRLTTHRETPLPSTMRVSQSSTAQRIFIC